MDCVLLQVMLTLRGARFLAHLDECRRTRRDEVEDDIAPLRSLTLEERGKILESVCRDAMAILRARRDFAQAMAAQEPRSDESMQLWINLVKRYRSHGRD